MKEKPTKIDLKISSEISSKCSPQELKPNYKEEAFIISPKIQALVHNEETFSTTRDDLIEQSVKNKEEYFEATIENSNKEENELKGLGSASEPSCQEDLEDSGRERLKRHRVEVAGRIWIPEIWGQEELLKDWIDCSAFDASLSPNGIMLARASLIGEGRRSNSGTLRIENMC